MDSLKKNKDFQNVYRNGKSYADKYLVMYVLENGLESNRIGISVSKKVGNSVVRHHLTRLLRESYRLHEEMFHSGWDIVVIVRVSAKNEGYHEVKEFIAASFESSWNYLKIISKRRWNDFEKNFNCNH